VGERGERRKKERKESFFSFLINKYWKRGRKEGENKQKIVLLRQTSQPLILLTFIPGILGREGEEGKRKGEGGERNIIQFYSVNL